MLRHKTAFLHPLFFFSNGKIALPSLGLLASDHLRQDICSPYRHQPHHRPIGYGSLAGWIPTRFYRLLYFFYSISLSRTYTVT